MMKAPVIIKSGDVETTPPPGSSTEAGWMKRMVYPDHVTTSGAFLGVSEVNPGYSVHRWHKHTTDGSEGYEVIYPDSFEEIYYLNFA